jgi:hypothetical protein
VTTRVHLLHGIHTERVSPVQEMIPLLTAAGFEVVYPDYGFIFGVETRIVNPIIRGSLFPYVGKGDVMIGHSNGCAIIYDLLAAGAPASRIAFINPALESIVSFPSSLDSVDVYYNPGDEETRAAEIARRLGIVDPVWGEMGHSGYQGLNKDTVTNFNCGATPNYPVVDGHSEFFLPANLKVWGPFLVNRLKGV